MPDAFFDNPAPAREGEPPTAARKKGAGGVLQEPMGPLPIWGWVVVALGAVFMFRRFNGVKTSQQPNTTTGYSPGGGGSVGGVFLLPGAGGAPAAVPAATAPGFESIWSSEQQQIGQLATQFGGNGNDAGRNFLARNAAARQLGLPYVISDPNLGALVTNPQTGSSVSASLWNSYAGSAPLAEVHAVGTGDPGMWDQFRTGKLPSQTAPRAAA